MSKNNGFIPIARWPFANSMGEVVADLEITELAESYRNKFDVPKNKYPSTLYLGNADFAEFFGKKMEAELQNVIKDYRYNSKKEEFLSYQYKTDNHVVILSFFPMMENSWHTFIFYADKELLEKDIHLSEITYYTPGTYYLKHTNTGYYLKEVNLKDEVDPILNDDLYTQIKEDIEAFFNKKAFYLEHQIPFKRGILLYGPPGNGKTTLIRTVIKNHPEMYGVIIENTDGFSSDITEFFKKALHDKQKIIIIEDIDGINEYERSAVLNFLDGLNGLENAFIVATTNHIDRVDEALVNRPSRFDRVYLVDLPDETSRKKLLHRYFPKLSDDELNQYSKSTEGFSGAYFKELFLFTNLHDCSIDKAIEDLKHQMELFKSYDEDTSYMG